MPKKLLTITGQKEINKKLVLVTGPQGKKVIRQSLRAAFKPMLAMARNFAPVRTGQSKRDIKIRSKRTRKGIALKISTSKKTMGVNSFYPAQQEFGWKDGKGEIEGKHYMEMAYDRGGTQAKDKIISGILDGLSKLLA